MTMLGLSWGLHLRDVTPLAKLVAIRLGDNCDQSARGVAYFEDLQEWCCGSKEEILDALNSLALKEDVAWDDVGDGSLNYGLPYQVRLDSRPHDPKPDMSISVIYVIAGRLGRKIGITGNIGRRVAGLRLATLEQTLALEWSERDYTPVIRRAERLAHQMLAAKLIRNEWFDVSHEEAVETVKTALVRARAEGEGR